eukprot:COSAG02_NODE_1169_length_14132_cov_85.570187_5_plen_56_part_00
MAVGDLVTLPRVGLVGDGLVPVARADGGQAGEECRGLRRDVGGGADRLDSFESAD